MSLFWTDFKPDQVAHLATKADCMEYSIQVSMEQSILKHLATIRPLEPLSMQDAKDGGGTHLRNCIWLELTQDAAKLAGKASGVQFFR